MSSSEMSSAALLFPLKGVSAIDREGQPFDDPLAREGLLTGIRRGIGNGCFPCEQFPLHINDPEFAEAAAQELIVLIDPPKNCDVMTDP